MNLRIVFKFKDCKLQFYEKRRLFCYFSVNPCMPASRWRRLLKLKRKKKTLLRLSLASFSPHHYSQQQRLPFRLFITRQKLPNALRSLKPKKSLQKSTNRASECHSPHHIYNSLLRMLTIHELKRRTCELFPYFNFYFGNSVLHPPANGQVCDEPIRTRILFDNSSVLCFLQRFCLINIT